MSPLKKLPIPDLSRTAPTVKSDPLLPIPSGKYRATHAITWGYSKDHRPDLKQLLYTLTVSRDGGVPMSFTSHSGNVVDDKTHCAAWDLLCQLVGSSDFLYVADCKLASDRTSAISLAPDAL